MVCMGANLVSGELGILFRLNLISGRPEILFRMNVVNLDLFGGAWLMKHKMLY